MTRVSTVSPEWPLGGGAARLVLFGRVAPLVACAGVMTIAAQGAAQEDEETTPKGARPPPEEAAAIGYRSSLEVALVRKRNTTAQTDSVVANRPADFADMNPAEALQRLPGVAITRVDGEGSRVTVRGLSGRYLRVRMNGLETRAGVGTNNDRGFDFNVFASELFQSIVVHKTASAELDEGSLGAIVDLNTAQPFNFDSGLTAVVGARGGYNDLSGSVRPRLTGLIAYRDPADHWGVVASAALSSIAGDVQGNDSGRWMKARFRSVNGVPCAPGPVTDLGCQEVADAFHARAPGYAQTVITGHRLGLTAGVHFRPIDGTEIRLDGLYANVKTERSFKTLEALLRGNESNIDISDYTLKPSDDRFGQGNSTLSSLTANNASVRSETGLWESQTDFHQITLALDHTFSERVTVSALAGTSRNTQHTPRNTTLVFDDSDYDGFRYDYGQDDRYPLLAYTGPNVTEEGNFRLTALRDQVHTTKNGFDTLDLRVSWDMMDPLKLTVGANYKNATFDTQQENRDGQACSLRLPNDAPLVDCDTDDDGMNDISGPQGFSEITEYEGEVGGASTTRWASPSLDDWVKSLNYYDVPPRKDLANTGAVNEQNLGFFLRADGEVPLGSGELRLLYDGGLRAVQTRQSSSAVSVDAEREPYWDWLPSMNTALWLNNELVVRLAAARVMARHEYANLSPAGSVDSFNFAVALHGRNLEPTRATALDAAIEWYFADESILSLALFHKDIDSFPIQEVHVGQFADTGLPASAIEPISPAGQSPDGTCGDPAGCWEISELTAGPGATLTGFEIAAQAPLSALFGDRLPPIVRGLGVLANYTYISAEADNVFRNNEIKERPLSLSNSSYNATLYYEDSKFGARLSVAGRGDFLVSGPNSFGNLWSSVESDARLDFATSYQVIDHLRVTFEALNLTNTALSARTDVDANRRLRYEETGRNFLLGARYTF